MDRRTFLTTAGATGLTGAATTANGATGRTRDQQGNATTTGGGSGNGTASGNRSGETNASSGGGGGQTHTVQMVTDGTTYYFDPIGLFVQPGDTVEWVIKSGGHSATSYSEGNPQASTTRIPSDAKSWNSDVLQDDGASFSYTFDATGTYDYYCIPHKSLGMVGRIVCGEPGGPATESPIPDKPSQGQMPSSKAIVEQESISFPYFPNAGGSNRGSGLPLLFYGGLTTFLLSSIYLFWKSDVESGRYDSYEGYE